MTLIRDKLGNINFKGITSVTLSSSAFHTDERQFSSAISINDKVKLTDSLACLKRLGQSTNLYVNPEEEERKRISRELHDGLGQLLTTMNLQLQHCLKDCTDDQNQSLPETHRESLEAISSMVRQAMSEVRSICSAIRPAMLDDLGLQPAISWQCRQIAKISSDTEVETDFDVDEEAIPEEYKSVIYRIVQESLTNAVKYSKAKRISVSLLQAHNAIHLLVIDDGIGFDPSDIQGKIGMGLVGMRERAESVNGRIRIDTGINQGVQIRASFPL